MNAKAYLEITMIIGSDNRASAAKIYTDYRQPFLAQIKGALSKELLIRTRTYRYSMALTASKTPKSTWGVKCLKMMCLLAFSPYGTPTRKYGFTVSFKMKQRPGGHDRPAFVFAQKTAIVYLIMYPKACV